MIEFTQGDILQADVEAVVNTVNCVGVMGRGIALQFRKKYPDNFTVYKAACDRGDVQPGRMLIVDLRRLQSPRFVVNFPTKRHWKGQSRLEDVRTGLTALVEEVRQRSIKSLAIPPLGCGLGGLSWNQVRPLIEDAFAGLPEVRVVIYEPAGAPAAEQMAKPESAPVMTVGRAALVGLVRRYLTAVMDPYVTLLEIHKLMYFMQAAGEPLRLRYVKAPYGPYSENLRHVLSVMEGHFILGYGDAEDDPQKQIQLLDGAFEQSTITLNEHAKTHERFNRVATLIDGFESPFGMELLATVHWVAHHEGASTVAEAVAAVHGWNRRKRMFDSHHVELAWDVLNANGWLA